MNESEIFRNKLQWFVDLTDKEAMESIRQSKSSSNETIKIEIGEPVERLDSSKFIGIFVIVGAFAFGLILLDTFLSIVLKSNPDIRLIAPLVFGPIFLIAALVSMRMWKKKTPPIVKSFITIDADSISWPTKIKIGEHSQIQNHSNEIQMRISDIIDFEIIPRELNTNAKFRIELKNSSASSKIFMFYNTLTKENEELLVKTLKTRWQGAAKQSPFSDEKIAATAIQNTISSIFAIFVPVTFLLIFFLFDKFYPIYFYSTLTLCLLYSLPFALGVALLIKRLTSELDQSKKMQFSNSWHPILLSLEPLFCGLIFSANLMTRESVVTIDAKIVKKQRVQHKSNYSYYFYLEPIDKIDAIKPFFEEKMTVEVDASSYGSAQSGQTAQITFSKGIFSIPIQEDIVLLSNSNP